MPTIAANEAGRKPARHPRTLHLTNPLTTGLRVLALQKLLNKKGFACSTDGSLGPQTITQVVAAKKALGYPKAEQLPIAGEKLMRLLREYTPPKPRKTLAQRRREQIVAYWRWGMAHEPQIHYRQARPFPVGALFQLPMYIDCSGFFSLGYKAAGAPDPNGQNWNGTGYTGTLLQHGTRITKAMLRPGDAVVFGAHPGHHVCGVIEAGSDPLLMSHGQERGPMLIRLSEEARYQPSTVAFIDYLGA